MIDRDYSKLHPDFRRMIGRIDAALQAENIPLKVFEAYRAPERQLELWNQGRFGDGLPVVTKALPWESLHQYGMAVDYAFFESGKWHWRDTGVYERYWFFLHKTAVDLGLRVLSFEKPHVQFRINCAFAAAGMIPGGDLYWETNMRQALKDEKFNPPEFKRYGWKYA